MAAALRHVPHLTKLEIGVNKISDAGVTVLAAALSSVPLLTTLNVTSNPIGAKGAAALAAALHHTPLLEALILSECGIGDVGVAELASALRHVPQLTMLSIPRNSIHDDGLISLSTALHHVNLKWLFVDGNLHTKEGSGALNVAAPHTQIRSSLRDVEADELMMWCAACVFIFSLYFVCECCCKKLQGKSL